MKDSIECTLEDCHYPVNKERPGRRWSFIRWISSISIPGAEEMSKTK